MCSAWVEFAAAVGCSAAAATAALVLRLAGGLITAVEPSLNHLIHNTHRVQCSPAACKINLAVVW